MFSSNISVYFVCCFIILNQLFILTGSVDVLEFEHAGIEELPKIVVAQRRNEILDFWKREDNTFRRNKEINTGKGKGSAQNKLPTDKKLKKSGSKGKVSHPVLRSNGTAYTALMDEPFTPEPEILDLNGYATDKLLNAYSISSSFLYHITHGVKNVNVTREVIGRTAEYNDIVLFKITQKEPNFYFRGEEDKYSKERLEKKIIFIVHGLSVMGLQYLECFRKVTHFKELLRYYCRHLDKFDIYLIPVGNPDGFAMLMTRDVPWNKNVSPQQVCPGVAIDRNFDVAWNTRNTPNSCSQQYPGPHPFSEPESVAIKDVFHRYAHKIVAYIHVHAGTFWPLIKKGDAVLHPVGFTDSQTDDDKYLDIRGEIEESLKNASFEELSVTVQPLHSWYGIVSGTSVDYATTVYGIPYAMEFVMQIYSDIVDAYEDTTVEIRRNALTEIWQRVIDAVFNNIWKNINNTD